MTHSENQAIEIIPTLLIGDSSFGSDSIPFCTLCIEIDERRIRFCIVKDENMECIWLEDYGFGTALSQDEVFERLKKIFTGHLLWSSSNWKNIRLAVNSHAFSLIPKLIFDKNMAQEYLEFALGSELADEERVLYHELPIVHANNVFSIPVLWYDWIVNHFHFANISFYHLTSPLIIGSLVSHAEHQEHKIASAFFEKDHFTFIVSEGSQLIFCNRFRFSQVQELVYIMLFTLNQLNFMPDEMKVLVYGEISPMSDLYKELEKFFPNLKIGSGPTTLKYSPQCSEIPGHRYFGLFNTYLVSS